MSQCSDILDASTGGKLALSAANAMNTVAACLDAGGDNWTAKNYALYNIANSACSLGIDETCTLDYPAQNQPTCPGTLGSQAPLSSQPVWNINYPNAGANLPAVSLATQ